MHKVCTCLFLLIFIKNFGCNGYKENELNTILEESLLFQLGQNSLYSNHGFWYDLQSKDTPSSINEWNALSPSRYQEKKKGT